MEHRAKFRSKKGQLPFVELNGEEIADSALIIKQLSEKFNKNLDAGKSNVIRVVTLSILIDCTMYLCKLFDTCSKVFYILYHACFDK